MIKAAWILVSINTLALLILTGMYFASTLNRNPSYEEKGWTIVLALILLFFVLLAAIPLYYTKSRGVVVFSGIISLLPWLLAFIYSRLK